MPKSYRRILFFTFLGAFLMVAPLLILYTAGYRYNWQRGRIQETGVLTINYLPRDATVSLNEEEIRGKPPLHLSGLLPGRYTIDIIKKGYHSWTKRLWIEPSRTTFAQHAILWRKESPATLLHEGPVRLLSPARNGSAAFVIEDATGEHLFILSPEKQTTHEIALPASVQGKSLERLLWSPNGRRLFIALNGLPEAQFVWSAADEKLVPLSTLAGETPLQNISWNAHDDDRLYGFQQRAHPKQGFGILEIDFFRGETRLSSFSTRTINPPYHIEDDLLYRIEDVSVDGEVRATLTIEPFIETARALERSIPLPEHSAHFAFLPGPDLVLTLHDLDRKTIYIIDKSTRTLYPIQETIDAVVDAAWSPHNNRLVWSTGSALFLLDLERSTREKILEGEKKIQEVLWHPGNEYLFFTIDDDIRVTEIDGRDERNSVLLATLKEHRGLFPVNNATTLVAVGRNDGVRGIYAFDIAGN